MCRRQLATGAHRMTTTAHGVCLLLMTDAIVRHRAPRPRTRAADAAPRSGRKNAIPASNESARRGCWSSVSIRIRSPFRRRIPNPPDWITRSPVCWPKSCDVSFSIYWGYSSHDSYPSKLATKELCDVMLGVMPDDRFGKRVSFSKPYYFSDYRFVVASGAADPGKEVAAGR